MQEAYEVAPVSRSETEILGLPTVQRLSDIEDKVDTLTLYVGGNRLPGVLDEILALEPGRVIFNPGTENEEIESQLEQAGIATQRACTLVLLRTGQF